MIVVGKEYDDVKQNSYADEKSGEGRKIINQVTQANNSFYFSKRIEECLERLKNNQSDFSTSMVSYYENLDGFTVPVQLMPSMTQFVSGYKLNLTNVKPHDCATVYANIQLLHPFVYLASFLFILSAIFVVATGIWIQFKNKEQIGKLRLNKLSNFFIFNHLMKELFFVYNGSSRHFRFISFLLKILSFYLVVSFNSLYKTSQVIVDEPFVIKDYKMLLDDEQSLPIFYDVLSITSKNFKTAREGTLREKVWSKLIKSKSPLNEQIITGEKNIDLEFLHNLMEKLNYNHFIVIGNTKIIQSAHTFLCSSSPESELWRLFMFTDESESEDLFGYPLSIHYSDERSFIRSMRKYFESHLSARFYQKLIEKSKKYIYSLLAISYKHQLEQTHVCSSEFKLDPELTVPGVSLKYYTSFFVTLIVLLVFSFIVNICEELSFKDKKKKFKFNRRHKIHSNLTQY